MADTKASADPAVAAGSVLDTDSIIGLFGGTNGRIPFSTLKSYLLSGIGLSAFTPTTPGLVPASGGGALKFLRADGAFAVPSGTATPETNDHPGYVAGRWYTPHGQGPAQTGAAPAVGTMYLAFGIIKQAVTVAQLQARVTTAFTGGNIQLAIYNHNPTTAKPGTLVASTGSGSTTTAANVSIALSAGNVAIPAGFYWFAIMFDNATPVVLAQGPGGTNHMATVGSTVGLNASNSTQPCGYTVTGQTFGAWPNDLSAATVADITTGRAPLVAFLTA